MVGIMVHECIMRQSAAPSWPVQTTRAPGDKNGLEGTQHHRPQGWEALFDVICRCVYVERVTYDRSHAGPLRIEVLDPALGLIAVGYWDGAVGIKFRVETTARGQAQSDLVCGELARLLRRWK